MPITVTCPNPSCGQMASVQDQHAGLTVQCPKCGGAIAVPGAAGTPTAVPPTATPGSPAAFSAGRFMANAGLLAGNQQTKLLLLIGLGCLGATVLATFLPWYGTWGIYSILGVQDWAGILHLLLSLGVGSVVVIAIVLNNRDLFNIGVMSAGGWSAIASLWRLIEVMKAGGASSIGLFLALFTVLGAAGTLGTIAVQRLMKK